VGRPAENSREIVCRGAANAYNHVIGVVAKRVFLREATQTTNRPRMEAVSAAE
jgi:hypothetical protein